MLFEYKGTEKFCATKAQSACHDLFHSGFSKSCFPFFSVNFIWIGLVAFYGISTIVGYLMPNPLYTYILNM